MTITSTKTRVVGLTFLVIACAPATGCSRAHYRRDADFETYGILEGMNRDPRWYLPRLSVEPAQQSRMFDPFDPDHPPLPPDDPAAHDYMHCVNGMKGSSHWHDDGDAPWVIDPAWLDYLERDKDGNVLLSPHGSVQLGLIHSREYQTQLENVYLTALALSLEQFEFDLQWFGRNRTDFEHFGTGGRPTEANILTNASNLGFSKNFSRGGQLIVDWANSFVWEFTGADSNFAFSNIAVSLVQPLLRGAGRRVRLEELTQSERNTLYAVRDFARFRKQFYFDITSNNAGYLSLLLQMQAIRNFEANLVNLERDLTTHEALAEAGIVSSIQVDQVFQQYQVGQLTLIRARNDFETALDIFKIKLGLPPDLPVKLDDSLLAPFEVTDPKLALLEKDVNRLEGEVRQMDTTPSLDILRTDLGMLKEHVGQSARLLQQIDGELSRWKLGDKGRSREPEDITFQREQKTRNQLADRVTELRKDLKKLSGDIDTATRALDETKRKEGHLGLQKLARRHSMLVAELSVVQTQIRAYLIELDPVELEEQTAIEVALTERLDLMNQRGVVVDAWRKIEVAANGLESDLDVTFDADIATDIEGGNPVKFGSRLSRYRVGLELDGPLNRKFERNVYRSELIGFQRARRDYIELQDSIIQVVRRDLRRLEAKRVNFEIARQSLVTAAQQVEQAREELLAPGPAGDSSTTRDVLVAINSLLEAKNSLIEIWSGYQTDRLQLALDLEILQLDEQGRIQDALEPLPAGRTGEFVSPPASEE